MAAVDDVMQLCCELFPNEEIKATLRSALTAAGAIGLIGTVAGIFLGPVGLLVAGVGGGLLSYWWFKDVFKPLPQILMELSAQEKQELYNHLMKVLTNMQWRDYAHLLFQVSAQPIMKQQLLEALRQFFTR